MDSFLTELKRRNVIRVGIAYLALAWLVLQVAEMLLPVYGFTDAAIRNLVAILAAGLLITLALSWAFEWTPAGIVKEADAESAAPRPSGEHKRLDRFIIFVLVLAVAFFGIDKFVLDPARDAREIAAATESGRADALQALRSDKSVAVLPFANRSALADDVYFTDGIHDDILTQLAHIEALTVTSRTSVERYRGTTQSMKNIGDELGVRAILEGGVQRAGNRVRINVQLIEAATDDHLWAETYDRELTAENIFAVQAEISASVAEALRAALLPEEQLALASAPTEKYEAYDLYLLGRFHWHKRTKESIDIARGHFEKAIEQDPDYVLALSGLADSYTASVVFGNMSGEDAFPLAQAAIDRAMAIDDSVSEVWGSLGFLRYRQRDLGPADEAFRRAVELDEQNFQAWFWHGLALQVQRRWQEAEAAFQRAYELEPMSLIANRRLAMVYDNVGDFARAIQFWERAAQLDDAETLRYALEIGWSYYWAGDYTRAVSTLRDVLAEDPNAGSALYGLTHVYLSLGDFREAKFWNDRLAAANNLFRSGHEYLMATRNFDEATVYVDESLRLSAPRRELQELEAMFLIHFAKGDIETARTWLAEYLEVQDGRIEVSPSNLSWRQLAVAAFWMTHGDPAANEPERGKAVAMEAREVLTDWSNIGWHRADTLANLSAANALLGDLPAAIARINESIDHGFRNQKSVLANPAFDTVRDTPEFLDAIERMNAAIEQDKIRLADTVLAEYTPPARREPVAVARELLDRYVGWYSDGNSMAHIYFRDDGVFFGKFGVFPPGPLLALSGNTFYWEEAQDLSLEFHLDDNGESTHFLIKGAFGELRMKRVDPPPPTIQLPRDVLACYEGTYALDRLGGVEAERKDSDFWTAEVYVDDEGTVWIDFDDQPRLEIAAFSETEFQLVGMEAQYRFIVEPETGECNEFVRSADGKRGHFYRQ